MTFRRKIGFKLRLIKGKAVTNLGYVYPSEREAKSIVPIYEQRGYRVQIVRVAWGK